MYKRQNKNKVVSLLGQDTDGDGKEDDLVASGLFIGESLGTIYDYEVEGIWPVSYTHLDVYKRQL